jgi:hypothetical protein
MPTLLTDRQLAALRGPQHWSPDDARSVLATWRASGLSRAAFCSRHDLSYQRLYLWARQMRDWDSPTLATATPPCALPAPSFLPVVVTSSSQVGSGESAVAIRLRSGVVLEVSDPSRVTPAWLGALVAAMEASR